MKKPNAAAVLAFTLVAAVCFGGCKKSEAPAVEEKKAEPLKAPGAAPAPALVSAEKTSFHEVTSKLDSGGTAYLYFGAEQCLQGLSGKVTNWRQALAAIPNLKPEDAENLNKVLDIVTNLIKSSGLEDISGFGLSSIAREPGFYRTKAMLHHYPGKGAGFLWTLFGEKPHGLEGLNLLSTNTALASFSDLNLPLLWSVIQKQVAQSGFPQVADQLQKLPAAFEKGTQLNWEKTLGSLGGEYGFVMTLDASKKTSIPIPQADPLEIPAPALMIVMKVKDDTIFNRVDEALKNSGQQIFRTDKPNLKMRTMALPLPIPIELAPTIATSGGYLFIGTTDLIIQEALAVKTGEKPGLKTTAEFQRLAKETPAEGNNFSFMSVRFGQTIRQIQQQAMALTAKKSGGQTEWLQSLLGSEEPPFTYSVGANTAEGWFSVANGNQHPARMLLVAGAVPVGIASAIAIPNIIKARKAAQGQQ